MSAVTCPDCAKGRAIPCAANCRQSDECCDKRLGFPDRLARMTDPAHVEFVDELPTTAANKWKEVRATLAGQPGRWAKIDAKGGYPKQRLATLGCEVRTVEGQLYARFVGVA